MKARCVACFGPLADPGARWLATNSFTALAFDGINDVVLFALGPSYNAYPP
jgi:hypothetical protein